MISTEVKYGRSIISPSGEVVWAIEREHYEAAREVIEKRGETAYDASSILEKEGWVRVAINITTPNFDKVKKMTQAQRDVIFDMAMAANEAGDEWQARRWMETLESIQE